jgi:hypothetical protein
VVHRAGPGEALVDAESGGGVLVEAGVELGGLSAVEDGVADAGVLAGAVAGGGAVGADDGPGGALLAVLDGGALLDAVGGAGLPLADGDAVGEGGGVDDPAAGPLDGGDGADAAPGADGVDGDSGLGGGEGGVHELLRVSYGVGWG